MSLADSQSQSQTQTAAQREKNESAVIYAVVWALASESDGLMTRSHQFTHSITIICLAISFTFSGVGEREGTDGDSD